MKDKKQLFSIRKFKNGASSVVIASLFFIGLSHTPAFADAAQTAEETPQTPQNHEVARTLSSATQKQETPSSTAKTLHTSTESNQSVERPQPATAVSKDQEQPSSDSLTLEQPQAKAVTEKGTDGAQKSTTNASAKVAEATASDLNRNESAETKNVQQDETRVAKDHSAPVSQPVVKIDNSENERNTLSTQDAVKGLTARQVDKNPSAKTDSNPPTSDDLKSIQTQAVATTQPQNQQRQAEKIQTEADKKAKQGFYKNKFPIVLVHGFSGFTDDINPSVLSHYWGGDKLNIRQDLDENGYNTYEASVSAFGSNYDRAVELYYYIKGGTVDYGAAHAEKYGHSRYGKTYEGIYKDWKPGQKVHLIGHSMGGQTIRQLEELLRHGSAEERAYQQAHGGDISPLFAGGQDGMVASITTLGTPHNGTHAADQLGNEPFIRQVVFDVAKLLAKNNARVDFGLNQWGLQRQPNESLDAYFERIKNNDQLWRTKDNGFYDLTREGATELNKHTSLNPNIVYKTYTGEATHSAIGGKQKADYNMFFPFILTGNVIGKAAEKEWRENDGLVSVTSSQHPYNQAWVEATDTIQKGVWQVTPVKHDWDHVDFVGQDASDLKRTQGELKDFWHNLAEDIVKSEDLTA